MLNIAVFMVRCIPFSIVRVQDTLKQTYNAKKNTLKMRKEINLLHYHIMINHVGLMSNPRPLYYVNSADTSWKKRTVYQSYSILDDCVETAGMSETINKLYYLMNTGVKSGRIVFEISNQNYSKWCFSTFFAFSQILLF